MCVLIWKINGSCGTSLSFVEFSKAPLAGYNSPGTTNVCAGTGHFTSKL